MKPLFLLKLVMAVMAERSLALYEPAALPRRIIDAWFGAGGIAAKPVMELGCLDAIKELVAAGLGCAIIPRMTAVAVPD